MSKKFVLLLVEEEKTTVHRVNVDKEEFFNVIMGIADGLITEMKSEENK